MSLKVDLIPGASVKVKLAKAGFITQEWNYTVPGTAADVTKTMVLEMGTLTVSTTPTGAKAGVVPLGGGSGIGCIATPCTFPPLASGDYTLTVEKAGYETITDTVTIVAGVTTTKSYTLTPSKGTLSITTTPTGATVKVGTDTKTSPCNFTLATGTYTVTVSKSGYDTITDTPVTITAGATTTKSYILTKAMPATVAVTATSAIPLWMWDEDGIAKIPCTRANPVKTGMAFGIAVSEEGENNRTTIVTPHVDTPEPKTIPFNITLSDPLTPVHLRGTYIGNVIVNGGAGTIHVNLTSFTPAYTTVTFVTKKEDGTELTGVDVWIDGVKKGTT